VRSFSTNSRPALRAAAAAAVHAPEDRRDPPAVSGPRPDGQVAVDDGSNKSKPDLGKLKAKAGVK
jgi:hypothetical protein